MQLISPEDPGFTGPSELPDSSSIRLMSMAVSAPATGLHVGEPLADAERIERLSALEDLFGPVRAATRF